MTYWWGWQVGPEQYPIPPHELEWGPGAVVALDGPSWVTAILPDEQVEQIAQRVVELMREPDALAGVPVADLYKPVSK